MHRCHAWWWNETGNIHAVAIGERPQLQLPLFSQLGHMWFALDEQHLSMSAACASRFQSSLALDLHAVGDGRRAAGNQASANLHRARGGCPPAADSW